MGGLLTNGPIRPTDSAWFIDAIAMAEEAALNGPPELTQADTPPPDAEGGRDPSADGPAPAGRRPASPSIDFVVRAMKEQQLDRATFHVLGGRSLDDELGASIALALQAVVSASLDARDVLTFYPDPSDPTSEMRWNAVAAAFRWLPPEIRALPRVEVIARPAAVHAIVGRALVSSVVRQVGRWADSRKWSSVASRRFDQLGLGERIRVTALPEIQSAGGMLSFFSLQNRDVDGLDWSSLAREGGPWVAALLRHAMSELDQGARLEILSLAHEQLAPAVLGPNAPSQGVTPSQVVALLGTLREHLLAPNLAVDAPGDPVPNADAPPEVKAAATESPTPENVEQLPQAAEPQQTEPQQTELQAAEPQQTEPQQTEPQQTEPQQTEPQQTEPQQAEPQQTELQQTEPQAAEPQQTELQQTEPQAAEPQQTEPQQTEPQQTEPQQAHPQQPAEPSQLAESPEHAEPPERPKQRSEPQQSPDDEFDNAPISATAVEVYRRHAHLEALANHRLGRPFAALTAWDRWHETWPDRQIESVASLEALLAVIRALEAGIGLHVDVRAFEPAEKFLSSLLTIYDRYAGGFESLKARAEALYTRARLRVVSGRPALALDDVRAADELLDSPEERIWGWTWGLIAIGRCATQTDRPLELGLVAIDEAIRGLGFGVSGLCEHPFLLWGVMEWLAGLGCPDDVPAEVRAIALRAAERLSARAGAGERLPHPCTPILRANAVILEDAKEFQRAYRVERVTHRIGEGAPAPRTAARTLAQWIVTAPQGDSSELNVEIAKARQVATQALRQLDRGPHRDGMRAYLKAICALDAEKTETASALLALGEM